MRRSWNMVLKFSVVRAKRYGWGNKTAVLTSVFMHALTISWLIMASILFWTKYNSDLFGLIGIDYLPLVFLSLLFTILYLSSYKYEDIMSIDASDQEERVCSFVSRATSTRGFMLIAMLFLFLY